MEGAPRLSRLSEYIYGEYGEQWKNHIKSVKNNGSDCAPPPKQAKSMHAPDLDGDVPFVGELVMGKEHYAVYSSPADGSCLYHSFRECFGLFTRRKPRVQHLLEKC